ncbi:hypothetical protein [Actinotalea sp.]|uniref:hypothetical protein n=1 Tax=Actinotalea sp. TaxID=1872145 RepID=UPI003562EAC5
MSVAEVAEHIAGPAPWVALDQAVAQMGETPTAGALAGVAWLAVQGGAPVVPVAVLGTRRTGEPMGHVPGFRRRLVIEFGAPVDPQPADSARESLRLTADLVAAALARHVAESAARHGVTLPGDGPGPTV